MLSIVVLITSSVLATGQGFTSSNTGAIVGQVRNELDNTPIVEALVKIKNIDTDLLLSVRTDAGGQFVFEYIHSGRYNIEVTCDGYEPIGTSRVPEFLVDLKLTNQVRPPLLQLRRIMVAPPAPPTTVKKFVPLLAQQDGTRGLSVSNEQIRSLPLAGLRTFDQLSFLAAGVAPPPEAIGSVLGPGIGAGVGTAGQLSVNGLRSRGNNFMIDGSDNNDEDIGVRRQGFTALVAQPIESVNQLRVTTALARPQ
ncbi:MAG: carboxypeptidase regulatory-like domain-containing protein, partial [Acidobacteria bacterium]|nr:carboxypeptidase regulatory-like domain-containing protein [Acidobacteriota bacterium]